MKKFETAVWYLSQANHGRVCSCTHASWENGGISFCMLVILTKEGFAFYDEVGKFIIEWISARGAMTDRLHSIRHLRFQL